MKDLKITISELDNTDIKLLESFAKFEYLFAQALNNSEPHHLAILYELSNEFAQYIKEKESRE